MREVWNTEKIKKILPHRYPFLFIDRVIHIDEKNKRVVCVKNVTINDYFFSGHFPGRPVVPGVIMIEALAQASIVLFAVLKPDIAARHPDYYLGMVAAKFKKPVVPGDELTLHVAGEKILSTAGIVRAQALVGQTCVIEAEIAFGVKLNRQGGVL